MDDNTIHLYSFPLKSTVLKNDIRLTVCHFFHEAWTGIEPVHVGFADRSVTTSPPGQYKNITAR